MFVPVDSGTSGMAPLPLVTTRLVPSPPMTMTHATPCSRISRAARVESPASSKTDMSRKRAVMDNSFSMPDRALAAMLAGSGNSTTSPAPAPWMPRIARRTMYTFS